MVKNYQLKNKSFFGFILLGCYPQCGEFEKSIFSVKIHELYYHCRANGQTTIKSIRSFDEQFYHSRHNDITEHKNISQYDLLNRMQIPITEWCIKLIKIKRTKSALRKRLADHNRSSQDNLNKGLCDGQTYGWTDGLMDQKVAYRVACPQIISGWMIWKKVEIRRFEDKLFFLFCHEAFGEVGAFLELNGTTHEIHS